VKKQKRWTEYMPLDEIRRAARNPKKHADEDLEASVARFGYADGMIYDERTGRIVGGHGRLDALGALKKKGAPPPDGVEVDGDRWLIPVQRGWSSKNDADAEAFLVAVNNLVAKGDWNRAELVDMISGWGDDALAGTGFERDDVDELIASLELPDQNPTGEPSLESEVYVEVRCTRAAFEKIRAHVEAIAKVPGVETHVS